MKTGTSASVKSMIGAASRSWLVLTPVIVIQLSALRVSFLSTSVLEPAATLGVALVAVATGLTVLILAPELYTPLPVPRCRMPRERGRPRGAASRRVASNADRVQRIALRGRCSPAVLDQPHSASRPRTASDLIEDRFAAAGNQTVVLIAHRSEGLDRVDRVVSMAGDEMTAWGNPNMIGVR